MYFSTDNGYSDMLLAAAAASAPVKSNRRGSVRTKQLEQHREISQYQTQTFSSSTSRMDGKCSPSINQHMCYNDSISVSDYTNSVTNDDTNSWATSCEVVSDDSSSSVVDPVDVRFQSSFHHRWNKKEDQNNINQVVINRNDQASDDRLFVRKTYCSQTINHNNESPPVEIPSNSYGCSPNMERPGPCKVDQSSSKEDKRRYVLDRAKLSVSSVCDPQMFHRTNPDQLLRSLVTQKGLSVSPFDSDEMRCFFNTGGMSVSKRFVKEELKAAFNDNDMVQAIQSSDIVKLRQLHESGKNLHGCNMFGETFLHMACRRGSTEVVDYLINMAHVDVRVCDDHGRNPMHSACWSLKPQYKIMKLLLQAEPRLLLFADRRGHTPLMYVRPNTWGDWCVFIAMCHELGLLCRS